MSEPAIMLPPPEEVLEDSGFKKTGRIIRKQMVNLKFYLDVTEYAAEVYYNSQTGERCHARFPEGYVNDVNYGGSIKSLAFLLNNECCVSIDKTIRLISDLTDGKLNISKGMVNGLSKEFSMKTEQEKKELFSSLMQKPVIHTDNTNARSNGNSRFVFIVAAPVRDFEDRYDNILKEAHEEYEYIPPSKYYRDGYNLSIRMKRYKSSHLMFLHDIRVPHNNNLAKRLLRAYKRKQHQVISFRSDTSIDVSDSK